MPGKERKVSFDSERLKTIMKERHFTRAKLCEAAGLSFDTFNGYMRTGKIMPDALEVICRLLDCSEDYLLGHREYDSGYYLGFTKADKNKTVEVNATAVIPKSEVYALLCELYEYPNEVIQEIRRTPESSKIINLIDGAMLYIRYIWATGEINNLNHSISSDYHKGLLQSLVKSK